MMTMTTTSIMMAALVVVVMAQYMHVKMTCSMSFSKHCSINDSGWPVISEVRKLMPDGMCPPADGTHPTTHFPPRTH
eukprot:9387036-Karenia_brevis.AAC.1